MARGRQSSRKRAPRRLSEDALYQYALNALAARARSTGEMRRLLARRAREPEAVGAVIERLSGRGYLDDQRFAEAYASARIENQRLGRARVFRDLRARQVPGEVAEQAIRKTYTGVDEAELLREHLAHRLRGRPPEDSRKFASLYRALRRAGFSHRAVFDELRGMHADAGLLDSLAEEADADERG